MNAKTIKLIVVYLTIALAILVLGSCSKMTGNNDSSNVVTTDYSDDQEETPLEPIDVSFHDISFTVPGEYEFDSTSSDDNTTYYKVYDDNGDLKEMVYAIYQEGNRDDNILDESIASAYCEAITTDSDVHDYTGYDVIPIDEKLSALYFTFQLDSNDKTYNNAAVVFNNDEGHVYSIYASSADENSETLLQGILDSLQYDFEIWQKRFTFQMEIKFEENLFLDIYDVEVYLDDEKLGTIKQGKKFQYETKVKEGKYNIIFYKSGKHQVSGSTEIQVSEDKIFYCTIKSHSDDIEIKNQEEAVLELDDQDSSGFGAHDLILTVEYESNMFLNKYDVDIYLNNKKIGSVSQGNTFKETVSYKAGEHDLIFRSSDDRSVKGVTSVNLDSDRFYSCSIKAQSSEIEINKKKTETVEEYNRKKALEEAQKRAEEAQKEAQAKAEAAEQESRAQFETSIKKSIRKKITKGEKISKKYGYEVRLFNLDGDDITKKYHKKDEAKRKTYRIHDVDKIDHEQKYVNLIVGTVKTLSKEEKRHFSGMKKEPLKNAYSIAKEDGYTLVVNNREGKRVDNKKQFKKKNYVFMSVSKVNYDKATIVVNADTKKHIAELKEAARRKAKERAKKIRSDAEKYAADARDSIDVIVTRTGKYHLDGCPDLNRAKYYWSSTYGKVKNRYHACLHCHPDAYCQRCYQSSKEEYLRNHK